MMVALYVVSAFIVGLFIGWRLGLRFGLKREIAPQVEDGKCRHVSSEKLKVSQFGDKEPQYLCIKCGEKVSFSELMEKR